MKVTFISNYLHKNNKGQTLIEVVITLGIALIIITSILVLVNASNRRATIARQSTQASKLAQEGMEIVRNIRDVNDPNAIQNTALCFADCSWKDLYASAIGTEPSSLQEPPCGGVTESWCLVSGTETVMTIFERTVEISDEEISATQTEVCADSPAPLESENIKRVTVTVSWESPIGDQERKVVSCLSNWR